MQSGCNVRWACLAAVLAAGLVILTSPSAPAQPQQQPRMVYHEMFTATWCVYCPSVRAVQTQLFALYPTQYIPVQIHQGDPWSYSWGNTRASFYGVTGYPTTVQDGILRRVGAFGDSTYINDFLSRRNVPTDVVLTLGGQQISGMQYQFTANVGLISTGTARTVNLHMVQVLDDYPHDPQYPQFAGNERNCFIQAATSQSIALTPGNSTIVTRNFTFSGDSAANLGNVRIVAWVQNTGAFSAGSEVYQAAYTSYPFFPDCNGNSIPDPDELANCPPGDPTCADCNGNGILDSCDILGCSGSWACKDCDGNGVPDGCEYSAADCNNNGVSDQCEIVAGLSPDCNNNGVPDSCDLAAFTSPDCNHNAVPDECDLAACVNQPWCDDCNNNGKIDYCDLVADYDSTSPNYAPLGTGYDKTHVFTNPPVALGSVTFTFTARGDLSAANENVAIYINGNLLGTVYTGAYFDCQDNQIDSLTMTAAAFNAAKQSGGGDITVLMIPSTQVAPAPASCPTSTYIRVKLFYNAVSTSIDDNGNGIPDECEGPAGCPGDMNCDGSVTFDDIDLFVAALGYPGGNGWPHTNCPWSNGDCNGDNDVTFDDIDPFVALIGSTCP